MRAHVCGLAMLLASLLGSPMSHAQTRPIDPEGAIPLMQRGDYDKALAFLLRSLASPLDDERRAFALRRRGELLQMNRRYDEAQADFSESLRLDPAACMAFYQRGGLHRELGRVEHALADARAAVACYDREPGYRIFLGTLLMETGRPEEAEQQLALAMQSPLPEPLFRNLADAYVAGNQLQKAYDALTLGIEEFPRSAMLRNQRGMLFLVAGDYARALPEFDAAVRLDPTDAAGYANRGVTHRNLGALVEARRDLDTALKIDPRAIATWNNRAVLRGMTDDVDGMLADVERALALDPRNASALAVRAEARLRRNELDLALKDAERAAAGAGQRQMAHVVLCLVHARLGDATAVERDIQSILPLGADLHAAFCRGVLARQQGDRLAAERYFADARSLAHKHKSDQLVMLQKLADGVPR